MKIKIIIGIIVVAAIIIGILSVVFSSSPPSIQKTVNNSTGYNSTGIASPAPASGHHYGIVLNETTIVTAHP